MRVADIPKVIQDLRQSLRLRSCSCAHPPPITRTQAAPRALTIEIVDDSMCHEVEARSNVYTGAARVMSTTRGLTRWPES
jgi:hypothetical protein